MREISVKDKTDTIRVSLWREAVTLGVNIGQTVVVKDATLSYNDFYKDETVSINDVESLEVNDGNTPLKYYYSSLTRARDRHDPISSHLFFSIHQ